MNCSLSGFIKSIDIYLGKEFFEKIKNVSDADLAKTIVEYENEKHIVNSKDWISISGRFRESTDIYHDYKTERINLLNNISGLKTVFEALKNIYKLNIHKRSDLTQTIFGESLSEKSDRYFSNYLNKIRAGIYLLFGIISAIIFMILGGSHGINWYGYIATFLIVILATELYLIPKIKKHNGANTRNRARNSILKEFSSYGLSMSEAEVLYSSIYTLSSHQWIFTKFNYIAIALSNDYNVRYGKEFGKAKKAIPLPGKKAISQKKEITKPEASKQETKLIDKPSNSNNDDRHDQDSYYKNLLDKANEVIRASNERINFLKKEIMDSENHIRERERVIIKLKQNALRSDFNMKKNEVFGLDPNCLDKVVIKHRYKQLSNIYHPDKSKSEKMMKIINNAYDEYLRTLR